MDPPKKKSRMDRLNPTTWDDYRLTDELKVPCNGHVYRLVLVNNHNKSQVAEHLLQRFRLESTPLTFKILDSRVRQFVKEVDTLARKVDINWGKIDAYMKKNL